MRRTVRQVAVHCHDLRKKFVSNKKKVSLHSEFEIKVAVGLFSSYFYCWELNYMNGMHWLD